VKRGGPIQRRTPLRSGTKRMKPLKRAPMSKSLRQEVYDRSQGLCDRHGLALSEDAWHAHHRKLRTRGGQDSMENLVALCPPCHDLVHANPLYAEETGFMVHSWQDPAVVPIFKHFRTWTQPTGPLWLPAEPIVITT
jgi:hypothetical protein